ncbi:hypothetical protein JDW21_18880 [Bacillus subtilis]|uniref:Uncharacterized protein n=1 Tax=Bacillus phage vB_BsuS_PJN02 TaxID=2920374 RepID=A0AC61TS87_9CAUD|nr:MULTISPECIES: hypothetical protein [Bacillus subtilis group]YP_010681826.1 hypothetical protein PQE76_gp208 [Bacillus phage vB_BsuS_PJN02]MCR4362129.1 hypothetical protein [Bacillus subtilis]UNH58551.1 hypothetical protein [Bacillus phage vB_BsuS_PJN02]UQB84267.1 hypothetical protein KMZ31_20350 [Bacillus amyloliquefaciens]WOF32894.1 hypothetical protein OEJ84_23635 [Bacillus subtilis]
MDAEVLKIVNKLIKNKEVTLKDKDQDKLHDIVDEIGRMFSELDLDYLVEVISKDEIKITLDD